MDILLKIIGVAMIIVGFLIVKHFPGISKYQSEKMAWTGISVGLIILFFGVALLLM